MKAAEEIGTCLEPATGNPDLKGTYAVLKSWYHHASKKSPTPSWADMTKVTGACTELNSGKNPPSPLPPMGDQCISTPNPLG